MRVLDKMVDPLVFDRPIRVCHLAKFYPPATGGIESHLQTLAQAQARLGARVRVVCVNHLDVLGKDVTWRTIAATPTVEERDGDVEVLRIGRRASLFRLDFCPGLVSLGKCVRQWQADVIHLHVPNPTMVLALLPHLALQPLVVTYHSDVIRQKLLGLAFRPFESLVYGRVSKFLASSPPYAEGSSTLRRHAEKVQVVPFGIDLEPHLKPSEEAKRHEMEFRETLGQPLWLSVGRLVYYKGLTTALAALRQVPGKLLSIGEGPLRGSLQEQAKRLGVADRVIFLGRATNEKLIGAYRAATAFWFPSNARSEAFGIVQLEAMANGCPVINTMIPDSGVPWVSKDGESGLSVPVNDPSALARAALSLLEEPRLREGLSDGARQRAVNEFCAVRMAERTLATYRDVLAERVR